METQGTVVKTWFKQLDHLCISPKPPSSGNPTEWRSVAQCLAQAPQDRILKVVVFDSDDIDYAGAIRAEFPDERLYLSVGNRNTLETEDHSVTADRIAADTQRMFTMLLQRPWWPTVRLLPQVHAMIWGNKRAV